LAEAEAKIAELNMKLPSQSESFEQEKQKLNAKFEVEVQKTSDLQKSLTGLQNKSMCTTAEAGLQFGWSQLRKI
jgi:hypothetical protein